MKQIKTAVLGCGMISETYLDNLRRKFRVIELAGCADIDAERCRARAEQFSLRAMTPEQLMDDPEIEMVINLTNPLAHAATTRALLEHGKHVFSEKMLAADFAQGRELCRLAAEKQLRLGAAPDTFLGGGLQTAQYALAHGLIGTPRSAVVSLGRNYRIFGEMLPHLYQHGGSILYDMGCYYFTALCCLLGPVRRISAMGTVSEPNRVNRRLTSPAFGQAFTVAESNILAAVLEFADGCLATVHLNSETNFGDKLHLELYGSDGCLTLGDPNTFDGAVMLGKPFCTAVPFPHTHGYLQNSRGVGAAEMAWSIAEKRPHRASMEMGLHVLEIAHGISASIADGRVYEMQTTMERPRPLPEGFVDAGLWGPTEETALME